MVVVCSSKCGNSGKEVHLLTCIKKIIMLTFSFLVLLIKLKYLERGVLLGSIDREFTDTNEELGETNNDHLCKKTNKQNTIDVEVLLNIFPITIYQRRET